MTLPSLILYSSIFEKLRTFLDGSNRNKRQHLRCVLLQRHRIPLKLEVVILLPVPFENLHPKQKEVVTWERGALLVLAGPGTGKTEVLMHRIAYLANVRGVQPNEILAITFSRKAARQMTERLAAFKIFERDKPRISTLHSEALRILGLSGSTRRFLLDNYESMTLMNDAAEDLRLHLDRRELRKIGRRIGLLKADNKLASEVEDIDQLTRRLYERYEELLSFNHAVDLDGLIMRVIRVLPTSNIDVNATIKHVLVDEYQDINRSEFRFIKMLTEEIESLLVVGDDDQSIYGWRGADPSIIRNFQKDFEDGQIEILEESHRCTDHIIKGAQAIVSKDEGYRDKPLCSVRGEGSPIHIVLSKSWIVEADWIARWIRDNVSNGSFASSDIVVLCKTLNLADAIPAQLRINGIDTVYWRSGGLFTHDIVLDILAHIRLLVDKEDNLALRRCTETRTGNGIGGTCVRNLRRIAESHSCSLWEIMVNASNYADLRRWRTAINRFIDKIEELESKSCDLEPHEAISLIASDLGMSRRVDVRRLREFAMSSSTNSLEDFLVEVIKNRGLDLVGGVPEPEEEKKAVTIMSMHSAKGLTFDVVFLLGMDQRIMPDPNQNINEQRRLCYVAMTRARKELFLCHSKMRKGPAARGWSLYNPSRFLFEIPREHKEFIYLDY